MHKEVVYINNTFKAYSFKVNTEFHLLLRNDDGSAVGIPLLALARALASSFNPDVPSELQMEYEDDGSVVLRYDGNEWKLSHHELFEMVQAISGDAFKPSVEVLPSPRIASLLFIDLGGVLGGML